MQDQNQQLIDMQDQITRLKSDLDSLSQNFYKNNFNSSQTFNKDSVFTTRLKVPVFSSAPTVAEVGDIMAVAGVLYICTTAGNVATPAVWTLVGTQS